MVSEKKHVKQVNVYTISLVRVIVIGWFVGAFVVITGLAITEYINVNNQYRYTMASCFIMVFIMIILTRINTTWLTFTFSDNKLKIKRKNKPITEIAACDIKNYAIYNMFFRKWGFVIHIKTQKERLYMYITDKEINKVPFSYKKNNIKLSKYMKGLTGLPSRKTIWDYLFLLLIIVSLYIMPPAVAVMLVV